MNNCNICNDDGLNCNFCGFNPDKDKSLKLAIKLKREMFRFSSQQNWVNNAQRVFGNCGVHKSNYICIDSVGNVCRSGKQFMDATKNRLYPVIVYELQ